MRQLKSVNDISMFEVLDRIPAFSTLYEDEKRNLLDAKVKFFEAEIDELIVEQETRDKYFFLLVAGKANVYKGVNEKKVLATVEGGDFIGELAFFANLPRIANVKATQSCILMRIDNWIMSQLPASIRDKIKNSVIAQLASKVDFMNDSKGDLMDDVDTAREVLTNLKIDINKLKEEYPHIQSRIDRGDLALSTFSDENEK